MNRFLKNLRAWTGLAMAVVAVGVVRADPWLYPDYDALNLSVKAQGTPSPEDGKRYLFIRGDTNDERLFPVMQKAFDAYLKEKAFEPAKAVEDADIGLILFTGMDDQDRITEANALLGAPAPYRRTITLGGTVTASAGPMGGASFGGGSTVSSEERGYPGWARYRSWAVLVAVALDGSKDEDGKARRLWSLRLVRYTPESAWIDIGPFLAGGVKFLWQPTDGWDQRRQGPDDAWVEMGVPEVIGVVDRSDETKPRPE